MFIPVSFHLVKEPLKLPFWYEMSFHRYISFDVLHIPKSPPSWIFGLGNPKNQHQARSVEYGGYYTYTNLCFTKNI